jgi:hypothetical protein
LEGHDGFLWVTILTSNRRTERNIKTSIRKPVFMKLLTWSVGERKKTSITNPSTEAVDAYRRLQISSFLTSKF